jgi:transcriptional regulator with XRE-family HTH domain
VDTLSVIIYKTIRDYLSDKHLSPKQLAARLDISESYMSMLRLGRRRPSPDLAQKIEAITGVPFKKLLLKEKTSQKPPRRTRNRKPIREQSS